MRQLYRKYRPHYITNLTLAIPVVISQLGFTMIQVADSIIVGHFAGTVSLAAVSLGNSLFTVVLVFGIGTAYGITPLIAQENGRNNFKECGKLLINSLLINAVTGTLLYLIVYHGVMLVINDLDQAADVVAQAGPYLNLLGFSIIPFMIFIAFKQFAEGLGFTKQAMMISIWGNVLNIVLGIIFVKGMFGIEPMGVRGVGLSTLIDRWVMAFVMAIYIFRSRHFRKYLAGFALGAVNRVRSISILKIGAPVALQYTFEVSAFGGAAVLMGMISKYDQAAHQVALSMASATYMMASGISAAAGIKTGNNFGKTDFVGLRDSALSSYHIVLALMTVTAIIFIGFHNLLPWLYTSDVKVITIAAQLLIIAGVFQLFDGTQVVGLGILRGMGDVNIPTWITLLAYWVLGLPLGYFLGITLNLGAAGIWYGLTFGLLISALLLFWRFEYLSKGWKTLKVNN